MVKIYNLNNELQCILENAYNISYEKRKNELYTCSFSLPYNDTKKTYCQPFYFVRIYENSELVETFRIMPNFIFKDISKKVIKYQCEHVLGTLMNDILFQYHEVISSTTTVHLNYILTAQTTYNWILGSVDFTALYTTKFENTNLLESIFAIPQKFNEDYMFTFDTSSYPFILNLERPSTAISSYIRYEKNLVNIEKEEDPRDIITRLYPLGYGEGINQLTVADVTSGGDTFINSSITAYGTISAFFVDKSEEDATSLLQKATTKLTETQEPKITYLLKAAELYTITSKLIDKFVLGSYVNVYDSDLNININTSIVSIAKNDIIENPGDIDLELSNKVLDVSDLNTNLTKELTIEQTNSQGSTNIDSNDYQDNCDATHPATISFYIPSETIRTNKIQLSFSLDFFRAYSLATGGGGTAVVTSSAGGTAVVTSGGGGTAVLTSGGGGTAVVTSASGGSAVQTSASGGSATQTSGGNNWYSDPGYTSGFSVTSTDGDHDHGGSVTADGSHTHAIAGVNHSHSVVIPSHTHSVTIPSHTHSVTLPSHTHSVTIPSHTHNVTIPSHTHNVTLPSHTHSINYGIYEYSASATATVIKVDGNTITSVDTALIDFDIIPYLTKVDSKVTTGAWHTVTITPNTLSRVTASVIKQLYIQSRGGGDY